MNCQLCGCDMASLTACTSPFCVGRYRAESIEPFRNQIICADALALLKALPNASIDAIVTDPPYPEIKRGYGTLSEDEWTRLMQACVRQMRRVLKPQGSAMMVLQANYQTPGSMRAWLWRFQTWCSEFWNVVQDAYWWNIAAMPTSSVSLYGLMRTSVKPIVWIGNADCLRNQNDILWTVSDATIAASKTQLANRIIYAPSGNHRNPRRMVDAAIARGGSTPMNLFPVANTVSNDKSSGGHGHGAGTPSALVEKMVRYISPPNGIVLDPFMGSGTTALVASRLGRDYIGSDLNPEYVEMACNRIDQADPTKPKVYDNGDRQLSLFEGAAL